MQPTITPSQSQIVFSGRAVVVFFTLAIFIGLFAYYLSSDIAGTKPIVQETRQNVATGTTLSALRQKLEAEPKSLTLLREMAREIFFAQKNAPHDTKALTLELVDILGRILEIERTDQEALLALADVSYQERVYDKAAEYYERYLKIQPVDTNVRARYASSLTVTGKADQAIRELDKILEKDSDNFAALAYLTVAYAQVGDKKRALDIGARAMELAQEGEARHELKKFIDKIDNREIESLTEPSSVENATPDIKKFEKLLRSNSVAGAKVKSVELEAQFIIKISMNDFPMQAMPEFAKNKFISSLKGYMLQAGLSPERYKLRFIAAEDHRLLGEF